MIIYGNAVSSGRVPRKSERVAQEDPRRECPRCRRLLAPTKFPRRNGAVLLCADCARKLREMARER